MVWGLVRRYFVARAKINTVGGLGGPELTLWAVGCSLLQLEKLNVGSAIE